MRFIPALLILLGSVGIAQAATKRQDTGCKCRDSIILPKYTPEFRVSLDVKGEVAIRHRLTVIFCTYGSMLHRKVLSISL